MSERLSYRELAVLLERAKNGDQEAFTELYSSTYRPQYFIAFQYLHNAALAEEAVQNMYIQLYRKMDTIQNPICVVQWMNQCTINACHTILRNEKIRKTDDIELYEQIVPDSAPTPGELVAQKEDILMIQDALNQLEPTLRSTVILRYINGMKTADIADSTAVSIRTVHRRLREAEQALRKILLQSRHMPLMAVFFFRPYLSFVTKTAMHSIPTAAIVSSFHAVSSSTAMGKTSAVSLSAAGKVGFLAGKGAAVAAAAGTVGISTACVLLIPPAFTRIMPTPNIYTTGPAQVVYEPAGTTEIETVRAYDSSGALVQEVGKNDGYTLQFTANGNYFVEIVGSNNTMRTDQVDIRTIDLTCPEIGSLLDDGTVQKLPVHDSQSGINFQTIRVTDDIGSPVRFWVERSMVCCAADLSCVHIYIEDNLKNSSMITIRHS